MTYLDVKSPALAERTQRRKGNNWGKTCHQREILLSRRKGASVGECLPAKGIIKSQVKSVRFKYFATFVDRTSKNVKPRAGS